MDTCKVNGCKRQVLVISRGLCASHYARWQRTGDVMEDKPLNFSKVGSNNPHWRGGFVFERDRIKVYSPEHPFATKEGYVYRYRLVMEAVLGRYLEPYEVVHHINGKQSDDRPENLVVTTQSKHINIDRKKLQTKAWWDSLPRGRDKLGRFV